MSETSNLRLPFIMPSQAQKHVPHNEALRALDALVHLSVRDRGRNEAPLDVADGARYLIGDAPAGVFAGRPGWIAAFQDGAWMLYQPRAGWVAFDESGGGLHVFDGAAWAPLGGACSPDTLGINASADEINRLAVSSAATLLTHEGAGHQLKINKASALETASLVFQAGFSGRAEMGLPGGDDFSIKVSPDGALWHEALVIDRASGAVSLPNTPGGGGSGPATAAGSEGAVQFKSGTGLGADPTFVFDRASGRLGVGVDAPDASLHLGAANGGNLINLADETGASLWRQRFDGANFQTYLGRSTYFRLTGGHTVNFEGGAGVRADQFAMLTPVADHDAGRKSLRIGDAGPSYATAAIPLTRPNIFYRAWAWNGANGYSVGSNGWTGLEQTAAADGAARFFWRIGVFATPSQMTVDAQGDLEVTGSVRTGRFTVASLPSAADQGAGALVFVSDEAGGATLAFSDGSAWRRVADRAVVSA